MDENPERFNLFMNAILDASELFAIKWISQDDPNDAKIREEVLAKINLKAGDKKEIIEALQKAKSITDAAKKA